MFANLVYAFALALVSPLVLYRMIRHGRYRRGVREKLWGISASRAEQLRGKTKAKCVWIHAVSVGEVNLIRGVVNELRRSDPATVVVVSASTDTGYDMAIKHFGEQSVFFAPLDFTWAVKRTLRRLSPDQLVLAELELWPNLIRTARQQGRRVDVINARLSQRSAERYVKFASLTRRMFDSLNWVGCQDELSLQRFIACGTPHQRLKVTGSIKFDDAPDSRYTAEVQGCCQWAGVDPWHRVWVVGSTQSGEEEMALGIYNRLRTDHENLRMILVPRHKERFDEVAKLIAGAGLTAHRRSTDQSLYHTKWPSETVILVDTIGELRHWWGVGQIATVGGSFGNRGGQNMLEPAGYGSAVSFGPNTQNFAEISRRLIEAEGAVRVNDEAALAEFVSRCLDDIPAADSLGRRAREVVNRHRGATERTVASLLDIPTSATETKAA